MHLHIPTKLFVNAAYAYDGTHAVLDTTYRPLTEDQRENLLALIPLAAARVCNYTDPYIAYRGDDPQTLIFEVHDTIDALVENILIDAVAVQVLASAHRIDGLRREADAMAADLAGTVRRIVTRGHRLDFRDSRLRPRWS